jgi:hypothetical protein
MTMMHMPTRLLLAVGAAGVAVAPAIAAFAAPATHTLADNYIQNCTVDQTKGSTDLNCSPNNQGAVGGSNGLASESDLTQQNAQRHH